MKATDMIGSHKIFELDPAATMFALGRNEKRKYVICLSITLQEPIEKAFLQTALEKSIEKYPFFFIRIVNRKNRLFAIPIVNTPVVKQKNSPDLLQIRDFQKCEAQVTYLGNTIILEYSHAVSDGKGGLDFLLFLTAEYISLKYQNKAVLNGIPAIPLQEQTEDGYCAFAKSLSTAKKAGVAYRIKGTPQAGNSVNITTYRLSVAQIRQSAKEQHASITEYMAAALCLGIHSIQQKEQTKQRYKKIRLTVPVNLRTRFPCCTMRNFSLNVYPEIDPAKDRMTLTDICGKVHAYMSEAVEINQLSGRCGLYSMAAYSRIMKLLPLKCKRQLVQTVLNFPLTGSSMTFSNMGVVDLSKEMEPYILDITVTFSTKPEAPYSCSILSLGDTVNLTLLRTIKEPLLENELDRLFFALNISKKHISTGDKEC